MLKLSTTTIKRLSIIGALSVGLVAGGTMLIKPGEAQAAQRRVTAAGNCAIYATGGFTADGVPSGWAWSNFEDKLHGYAGKMYLAQSATATCAIPSDTALSHDSITYAAIHVRHVEADCTGSLPSVKAGSISYASGTYTEGSSLSYTQSGCNLTFVADTSGELLGWSYSSYFPMVRLTAGVGEPIFINGFWLHD